MITIMPHLHSFNYLLADSAGFLAVECHADRLRILYPQGDVLAVGNFYRHPDMLTFQKNRQQLVSRQRVAYLESGIWQRGSAWEAIQAATQDHSAKVCGHSGGHTTLWSVVADLTARHIMYSTGAPCCAPYAEVSWPVWYN